MRDNRGQVLVFFIILLPIFLLLLMIIAEIGGLYINKKKTIGVIGDTIVSYFNNNLSDDSVNGLIDSNVDDIKEKSIFFSENEIRIKLIQDKRVFGTDFEIEYIFNGIKQDDEIIISEG